MSRTPLQEFIVSEPDGSQRSVWLRGRNAWALTHLIKRGRQGCSPLDNYSNPGIRWSAYVFNIKKHGISIRRKDEPHGGDFSGSHARYFLVSDVSIAETESEAA